MLDERSSLSLDILEIMLIAASTNYADPIYGTCDLSPITCELIACSTFQRLKGINQSGASQYAYPEKRNTRYQHSIGVHLLLRRLGAGEQEQLAGLLHDLGHTAFSHTIDLVFPSMEHNYHEGLIYHFLEQPDLQQLFERWGIRWEELAEASRYPLLEQPLPYLCADRIDYSLRDISAYHIASYETVQSIVDDLIVVKDRIAMATIARAREFAGLFAQLNDQWYTSPMESYLYTRLALAIRRGLELEILEHIDLLQTDTWVWERLSASRDEQITAHLHALLQKPTLKQLATLKPLKPLKDRKLDPWVWHEGELCLLSDLNGTGG